MDVKTQLIEILKKEDYTFNQLAEYLGMSEQELTDALNNKTLELRNLELISKALRVPLYSFFRSENFKIDYKEKPYCSTYCTCALDSIGTEHGERRGQDLH